MTRRRILAALGGAVSASGVSQDPSVTEIAPNIYMPYVNLGGVERMPSNYSLWLELGGRGLDTALMYGDDVQAELGQAVASSTLSRTDIFVTTKIPCPNDLEWSSGDPAKDIEHTFDVLGLDYVDLMLLHWPCKNNPKATAAAYKAMEPLVAAGRARALGVSNFKTADIDALLKVASVKPVVNQCRFSIGTHDDDTLQRCQELGITYAAYSPLGGLDNVDVLRDPIVKEVSIAHGKSAAQVAFRWIIQKGVVLITATTKASHQRSDLDVFDFELTDSEMASLSGLGIAPATLAAAPSFGGILIYLAGGTLLAGFMVVVLQRRFSVGHQGEPLLSEQA